MLVSIHPGQITFTRILYFASSRAIILVKPTCPAFDEEYAVAPVLLKMRVPLTDDVTMTDPPFRFKKGTAYLTVKNVPFRLTFSVLSQSSGESSSIGAHFP